jgi:hypothetical protein
MRQAAASLRRVQRRHQKFSGLAQNCAELRADESRGARLDERRILGRDVRRHEVEVDDGQRDVLGVAAVLVQDAEHRAHRAVVARDRVRQPELAHLARRRLVAAQVDVADDALADEVLGARRRRLDAAHKLVADHAGEPHVALQDLEVGVAHADEQHLHQALALLRRRARARLDRRRVAGDDEAELVGRHGAAARSFPETETEETERRRGEAGSGFGRSSSRVNVNGATEACHQR